MDYCTTVVQQYMIVLILIVHPYGSLCPQRLVDTVDMVDNNSVLVLFGVKFSISRSRCCLGDGPVQLYHASCILLQSLAMPVPCKIPLLVLYLDERAIPSAMII